MAYLLILWILADSNLTTKFANFVATFQTCIVNITTVYSCVKIKIFTVATVSNVLLLTLYLISIEYVDDEIRQKIKPINKFQNTSFLLLYNKINIEIRLVHFYTTVQMLGLRFNVDGCILPAVMLI